LSKPRILIIEDDPALLMVLEATLSYGGFEKDEARTGLEGFEKFQGGAFDAILLDLSLPDLDGAELLKRIRSASDVPVLVVSGRSSEADRIEALDLGADDFVPKPFHPGELLARIRAALRRYDVESAPSDPKADVGGIAVGLKGRTAQVRGAVLQLTENEHKLLVALRNTTGEAVAFEALTEAVWGPKAGRTTSHLRVLVNQLRRKIESDPGHPELLQNVRGFGYRLRNNF
jgi:two-component system, OmpR family, KDP operon response regulator KdpE